MGSLISVGENELDCGSDCYCCDISTSAFTLSEDAFNKMKAPSKKESEGSILDGLFGIEIAKGIQSDEYLKLMRCVQDHHSKKYGLSKDKIEELCNSFSVFTKSMYQVGEEEEREVVNCVKEMEDVIDCNDPIYRYAITIDKHAQKVAEANSNKIKVDEKVFS